MTRVAVVDLGTNSTRLLVADVEGDEVHELERRLAVTRLGEAVDERRRLLPTAMARVRNVLVDYRRIAGELESERTLAVATSAVRDAENGEAFLGEIEWSYGFATQLLTGEDEARATFRGVAAGRSIRPGTVVVDVGGGSTELIVGGPAGVGYQTSLDARLRPADGAVPRRGSAEPGELDACSAYARDVLADALPGDLRRPARSGWRAR